MEKIISEVQLFPVKPQKGLVAFVSFVLFGSIYCSSVAVYTRPEGGFRLVYPKKDIGTKSLDVFHPITAEVGEAIEEEVTHTMEVFYAAI